MSLLIAAFSLSGCVKLHSGTIKKGKEFPVPTIDFRPHQYVVYKTARPLTIDGKLTERAWKQVRRTNDFVNITGNSGTAPRYRTHAKLLWDKQYLYIGIQLKEPNLWATMTRHDAPLYIQNACEIFIDPDGDTWNYLEFGINAMGTVYDLLLPKPYRDGGHPIGAYNIRGLKAKVSINGTINDGKDEDTGWTAEIAIPVRALQQLNMLGGQAPPKPGDQWRLQLARAERSLTVSGGSYKLKKDPKTNRPLPAIYTTWAPQGLVNLHYPEMWGYVQFSGIAAGRGHEAFSWHQDEQVKWKLRQVYYREKQYYMDHQTYTSDLSRLGVKQKNEERNSQIIDATDYTFLASSPGLAAEVTWLINQNGKIWHFHKQQPAN